MMVEGSTHKHESQVCTVQDIAACKQMMFIYVIRHAFLTEFFLFIF